jgi:hypothetical protein
MRIAQVVPLWEQIQSLAYSGVKRLVGRFVDEDECVGGGYDVTLFATDDSLVLARSEGIYSSVLWLGSPSQGWGQELSIAGYSNHEAQHLRNVFVAIMCRIFSPEGVDFFKHEMKPYGEVLFHSMINCRIKIDYQQQQFAA